MDEPACKQILHLREILMDLNSLLTSDKGTMLKTLSQNMFDTCYTNELMNWNINLIISNNQIDTN